jgi:hypothetical protein
MTQFLVFPFPEEAELAPSWAAGVARDGKDEKNGPTEAVGCTSDAGKWESWIIVSPFRSCVHIILNSARSQCLVSMRVTKLLRGADVLICKSREIRVNPNRPGCCGRSEVVLIRGLAAVNGNSFNRPKLGDSQKRNGSVPHRAPHKMAPTAESPAFMRLWVLSQSRLMGPLALDTNLPKR